MWSPVGADSSRPAPIDRPLRQVGRLLESLMSRSITIEDLYQFKFLSKPRISPDGERVAFVVTTIDERKHEYRSSIWMVPGGGGEAKRLTGDTGNAHSPSWSPDGRWLAFASDREGEIPSRDANEQKKAGKGKDQLWLLPTDGGEAHQLTFMPHGADHPTWSPDSQRSSARLEVKAMRVPSGDHAASLSSQSPSVSCCGSPPDTSIRNRCWRCS